jgi:hypothetical protein
MAYSKVAKVYVFLSSPVMKRLSRWLNALPCSLCNIRHENNPVHKTRGTIGCATA